LSPWFKNNCVLELEYLKKEEVFYFFSDENWIKKLIYLIEKNG
jgi:hypothetical protein